ncbi:hypothetical protein F220043C3_16140 [Enterocloster asparagiformis]|uniref:hypothetical protein n=1 Tax=Enterocloster asparagiformis TaxID=333367 RepID=UPI0034C008DD
MNRSQLIEDCVAERISRIIEKMDPARRHEYYQEQDVILQNLDRGAKESFEKLIDCLVEWGAEECKAVYKAGFLDGLWLGHKAF